MNNNEELLKIKALKIKTDEEEKKIEEIKALELKELKIDYCIEEAIRNHPFILEDFRKKVECGKYELIIDENYETNKVKAHLWESNKEYYYKLEELFILDGFNVKWEYNDGPNIFSKYSYLIISLKE